MSERDAEKWDAAQEGAELAREGLLDEAIEELERLCSEDADNEYAFFFLATTHYEKQSLDKALAAYVRALELHPSYLGARVGAAHTLRLLGRMDQAFRMASEAEKLAPDDADVHYLLGVLYFQAGEGAAARKHLERVVEGRPEAEVRLEIEGMLQVLRGEVDEMLPSEDED
jgi:tetratricopeptide (TPR) repeat protein